MTINELITIFQEEVKESGSNQKEIAKETGISESLISRILNNESKYVTLITANKIIEYLNTTEIVTMNSRGDSREFDISVDTKKLILKRLCKLESEIRELKRLLE